MPIWPQTTYAKAALFNQYGRGIVHMGLHIGVSPFVRDRGGRVTRKKKYKDINIIPYLDRIAELDAILNSEVVELITRDPSPVNLLYSFSFNGTGDDWRELANLRATVGGTGDMIIVDMNQQITLPSTIIVRFVLSIDGQIDRTTEIVCTGTASATNRNFRQMLIANVGPGDHDIGVWVVMNSVVSMTIRPAFGLYRIVRLNNKRAK